MGDNLSIFDIRIRILQDLSRASSQETIGARITNLFKMPRFQDSYLYALLIDKPLLYIPSGTGTSCTEGDKRGTERRKLSATKSTNTFTLTCNYAVIQSFQVDIHVAMVKGIAQARYAG
ncbi:unnamed protein product [Albugo candida]|uniref:Uncharacterized protein n=1 Tax=Albugo candida TaxID=65357 RepID=A0A024G262_9STRA|nr:unnamed protein product [Albugo candida]|eukprot:CCI40913.1 unnamed protein product [Albugo candida]